MEIETQPNLIAMVALLGWPLLAAYLYATRSVTEATVWTILGGYLLLPTGAAIKFEMIPAFDKNSVPSLCALFGCAFVAPQKLKSLGGGMVGILILLFIVTPLVSSQLNGDAIVVGDIVLPGVGAYDGISAGIAQFFGFIPFLLGRRYFGKLADIAGILQVTVGAALLYSLLMLFEIRMSPQLATWIYGYFPSSFAVEVRYGGYRPVVFLNNGLALAFLTMTATVAAAALWRIGIRLWSLSPAGVTTYLGGVLVLCKVAGALVYAIVLVPLVRWMKPRQQLRLALILVCVALTYPTFRTLDLFPDQLLVSASAIVNEERAASLKYRFDQENNLLAHAMERPWFGWGRFGRNRIYDDESGKEMSVTDGQWIITLGQFGTVGFLLQFALLTWPVFRAVSAFKHSSSQTEQILLAAMSLIVAVRVIDQLPNASVSPWAWLLAGALLGQAEGIIRTSRVRQPRAAVATDKQRLVP